MCLGTPNGRHYQTDQGTIENAISEQAGKERVRGPAFLMMQELRRHCLVGGTRQRTNAVRWCGVRRNTVGSRSVPVQARVPSGIKNFQTLCRQRRRFQHATCGSTSWWSKPTELRRGQPSVRRHRRVASSWWHALHRSTTAYVLRTQRLILHISTTTSSSQDFYASNPATARGRRNVSSFGNFAQCHGSSFAQISPSRKVSTDQCWGRGIQMLRKGTQIGTSSMTSYQDTGLSAHFFFFRAKSNAVAAMIRTGRDWRRHPGDAHTQEAALTWQCAGQHSNVTGCGPARARIGTLLHARVSRARRRRLVGRGHATRRIMDLRRNREPRPTRACCCWDESGKRQGGDARALYSERQSEGGPFVAVHNARDSCTS